MIQPGQAKDLGGSNSSDVGAGTWHAGFTRPVPNDPAWDVAAGS